MRGGEGKKTHAGNATRWVSFFSGARGGQRQRRVRRKDRRECKGGTSFFTKNI